MVQFQLDSNGKCAVTLKDVGNVGDCVPEKKDGEREAKDECRTSQQSWARDNFFS